MADIVVGYDGSDCARAALDAALGAAKALSDRVVIAFGFDDPAFGGETTDMRKALEEIGEARVAEAAERARAEGVDVETVVVGTSPAQALADLAAERDARMIVVGTRGESPLKGAIVGSTPHKLLQVATRPVLVVPVAQS